jgi:hypothetical protein
MRQAVPAIDNADDQRIVRSIGFVKIPIKKIMCGAPHNRVAVTRSVVKSFFLPTTIFI